MIPTPTDALVVSDYVICATLRKVPDVFNVELLWERVRGGQEGIFLLEALKRHLRAPYGHHHKETCYSHVIARLPERDYVRDDRLDEGARRNALLRELHRFHQRDLGRHLGENAIVRYRLEADPVLRPGEVQFLFGRAIHLPAENEVPAFHIQATGEGQSDWRELGAIYPGQRLTLLSGDRRASSFPVPGWPFPNGESILIVLRPGPVSSLVDVLADPPDCLNVLDDGEGGFLVRDRRNRALRLRVVSIAGLDEPVSRRNRAVATMIQAKPVIDAITNDSAVVAERSPAVADMDYPMTDPWGRREPVLGFTAELDSPFEPAEWPTPPPALPKSPTIPEADSVIPHEQLTWIPQRPATVIRVAGVALQRLSTYASAGITDWRICFNRAGAMVAGGHPDTVAWLRVDNMDRVFGEVVGSSTLLALPGLWRPLPELEFDLRDAPPPMDAHYAGWMLLPAPLALPVPRDRTVSFGRGSDADIAPRLLADPRSLRWDGNSPKTVGISAEYLGLSRRHLQLQARRDDWWVQLESQNMSAYRLDPTGDLLDVLSPGMDTATTAKPGELLVVGSYVLALGELG